jgi:hypothetical protein
VLDPLHGPLTVAALEALVESRTPEGAMLDFKRDLPDEHEKSKFELRADAAAFANAQGGVILYGIAEEDGTGCANSLVGVDGSDLDKTISRMTQLLRSRIEPPLPEFRFDHVPLRGSRCVLALRVGKSWLVPHLVEKNDESYVMQVRVGRSKVRFREDEIRRAYERSSELPTKVRRWRDERLAAILGGTSPSPLPSGPLLVLHAVPLSSVSTSVEFSATELLAQRELLEPLGSNYRGDARVNLDGVLTTCPEGYTQLFRNASIESVCGRFTAHQNGRIVIASMMYEEALVRAMDCYAELLERVGVGYPLLVFVTLLNARGLTMALRHHMFADELHCIDRDVAKLPEVLLETRPEEPSAALRPVFDGAWNACGHPGSLNYAGDNWTGRKSRVQRKGASS